MSTTAVESGVGGEIASHASYRSNINSFVPDTPYMRVPTCAFRSQRSRITCAKCSHFCRLHRHGMGATLMMNGVELCNIPEIPTNPRACAGSSPTQPSTRPSSKPSIGSPSWVNALLNAGVSQHQRALIAHCRGGWGIVGRGGVGHRCVAVWLWLCGCVGSVYNVRLHARSRGENNGAEQTLQHASFFPPMEQNRSSTAEPECVDPLEVSAERCVATF